MKERRKERTKVEDEEVQINFEIKDWLFSKYSPTLKYDPFINIRFMNFVRKYPTTREL